MEGAKKVNPIISIFIIMLILGFLWIAIDFSYFFNTEEDEKKLKNREDIQYSE